MIPGTLAEPLPTFSSTRKDSPTPDLTRRPDSKRRVNGSDKTMATEPRKKTLAKKWLAKQANNDIQKPINFKKRVDLCSYVRPETRNPTQSGISSCGATSCWINRYGVTSSRFISYGIIIYKMFIYRISSYEMISFRISSYNIISFKITSYKIKTFNENILLINLNAYLY